MTIKSDTHPTLIDVANVNQADGTIADVVEVLAQQNEMLMDMVVVESNQPTSHKHAIRTGLPKGVWRGYNQGVPPSKSSTATVEDTIGNYELYAEVDRDLANLNGNSAAWRLQEEQPFMESASQTIQKQLIYGMEGTDINGFTGLAPRYSELTVANAQSADNVINGGGTGSDNNSIWLIAWDKSTVFGLYPKGSQAGLMVEDMGRVTIENADSTGGRMEGFRTHYKWELGLGVRDWRYVVRIANLAKIGTSDNIPGFMFQAIERLPMEKGNLAFYMSRDMRTTLFQQLAVGVKSSTLTIENVGGVRTRMYQGIPIRRVDALAADEARVT